MLALDHLEKRRRLPYPAELDAERLHLHPNLQHHRPAAVPQQALQEDTDEADGPGLQVAVWDGGAGGEAVGDVHAEERAVGWVLEGQAGGEAGDHLHGAEGQRELREGEEIGGQGDGEGEDVRRESRVLRRVTSEASCEEGGVYFMMLDWC